MNVATIEQCRAVVTDLVKKLNSYDADTRRKNIPDRTIELILLDLDTVFIGRLHKGDLVDIEENAPDTDEKPNVRLAMSSDDLIDLTEGRLKFAHAWATGRVRLDASIRDLLRLRSLL